MKIFFKKNDREARERTGGFTLVELMVYVALLGILMTVVATSAYQLIEGGQHNEAVIAVDEEGTFLNRKINWALTGAVSASVTGGNVLTISRPDLGLQSPLKIVIAGNNMTIARGAGVAQNLNGDRFRITVPTSGQAFVYVPATGGKPPSVSANFLVNDRPFVFRVYLRQ